ncbi:hypothetical protein M404DRAFT_999224 [Pisolithus tinctorius Marx 270]|uniref:Uncharacterized protein n=1 Tax=Pisolithus tinctorius Marx 270 TaxID=870435 RepID=A0A0C3K8U4_PISTI|nr:hypothetical protein M404DRAFT_999224 [Pisolithus tinctorius Marx 270]
MEIDPGTEGSHVDEVRVLRTTRFRDYLAVGRLSGLSRHGRKNDDGNRGLTHMP